MINNIIHAIDIEDLEDPSSSLNDQNNLFQKGDKNLFEKPTLPEEEKNVDDIVNYFMENSSKRTMLYQNEPIQFTKTSPKAKKGGKGAPKKNQPLSKANFKKEMRDSKSKNGHIENKKITNTTNLPNEKNSSTLLLPFMYGNDTNEDFPDIFAEDPPDKMIIEEDMTIQSSIDKLGNNSQEKKNKNEPKTVERKSSLLTTSVKKKLDHLVNKIKGIEDDYISETQSDDSEYFVIGKDYDMLIECYIEEDSFININEVMGPKQEFEIVGGNRDLGSSIEKVLLPKKVETFIGEKYQAKIPPMDKGKEHNLPSERSLCKIWDPSKLSRENFSLYMEKLSQLTKIPIKNMSEEKAVESLLDHNYDTDLALKFCRRNIGYIKGRISTKLKKILI